jgi:hypothetical protein
VGLPPRTPRRMGCRPRCFNPSLPTRHAADLPCTSTEEPAPRKPICKRDATRPAETEKMQFNVDDYLLDSAPRSGDTPETGRDAGGRQVIFIGGPRTSAAPRSARFTRHADRVLCAAVVLAAVLQLAELPQRCPGVAVRSAARPTTQGPPRDHGGRGKGGENWYGSRRLFTDDGCRTRPPHTGQGWPVP